MNLVTVERDGGIATITLNRPGERNALNHALLVELSDALTEVARRAEDRVLVLAAAGEHFCVGGDLTAGFGTGQPFLAEGTFVNELLLVLHRMPKPSIARIQGLAVGAGLNLALGCDLTVAAASARLSEVFARRALAVDGGGSWLLPRMIGLHRAKELAFFADVLTAAEAHDLGLLNRVVPDDELDGFVAGWARRLADGPTLALAATKRLLNESYQAAMEAALAHELTAQAVMVTNDDIQEAMAAFFDKRDPTFRGA